VRPTFRGSARELSDLVSAVEHRPEDTPGWERGGLGQSLWSLLIEDTDLHRAVLPAIGLALHADDLDAAFRLLVIAQCGAADPLATVKQAVAQFPRLRYHPYTADLLEQIEEFGFVDVY
jgi:hypothetical protein